MGGEIIFFLVAIVAVVVLIAGGIMRGMSQAQEEERRRQQRKSRPPGPPRQPLSRPAANTGNELDRFLNEVQRRKSGSPPPVEAVPVATPVEPRPRPAARPSPQVEPPRPREKAPAPRRQRAEQPSPRSRRRQDDIPMVVPVEEVIPVVEVVEERHAPKWEPRTAGPVDAAAALVPQSSDQAYRISTPATRPPTVVSPAVVQLRELLRDRNSLRAAFMLKEILGPPRCKR